MKLRTRLIFFFLLVAWAPLGVALWQLTQSVAEYFTSEFDTSSDAVGKAVDARFQQLVADLNEALEKTAGNPTIRDELVSALEHGEYYGVGSQERKIRREATKVLSNPSLDTFSLVDLRKNGHVIAMAHRDGAPAPDTMVLEAQRAGDDKPFFRLEQIRNPKVGRPTSHWTLQGVRHIQGRVALVGGKVVDEKMLVALMVGIGREDVRVAFEIDGQRIAADFPGEYPDWPEGFDTRRIKVQQTGDKGPAALWSVYLSRRDLKTALRTIRESGLLLAGLGGLVALILGLWIARRLSKPLEELASAAGEVAAGRRDLVVRERGGADELAVLVRSFNVMTDELAAGEERLKQSERIAAWREIAKRIAHEIKNPLTPIQLNIEMLQRGYRDNPDSVDKQYREVIESTLYEVGRVKRIVDEFSHFARMPAPVLTTTCLGELIDSTIALHREVSGQVRLSRSGLPKLQASVDPDQMRQVLTNLIKNAIEAVDSDKDRADPGCVDVGLEVQANQSVAVITVADTGPGIPEEVRERLFTPYFTTKTLGTGLGLAIVHRIVAEHGGEISVSQRAEGGTCFVVRLPVSAS